VSSLTPAVDGGTRFFAPVNRQRSRDLTPAATYGASVDYLALPDREIDASLTGEVIKTGLPLYIPDVREETRYRVADLARREGCVRCWRCHCGPRLMLSAS